MFIRKDREREVDQQDQSDSGMQEVCQESSLEATNGGVDDDCNKRTISFNLP